MNWTSLEQVESAAGAQCAEFAGARLPRVFSSVETECRAVRDSAGLLDARNRSVLSLVGNDRVSFLQGMATNNVAALAVGDGCYAALLTIQGRIVSDLYVLALDNRLLLDVPASRADAVRVALDRLIIADDVEFEADAIQPLVSIEGPRAPALLSVVAGAPVDELQAFQHREITVDGIALRCVAISQTGELGFRLLGESQHAATLWERVRHAGAAPVGLDALNVLRLEAGIAWHGVDMDEDTLVMEVGLDDAISFNKGCYLGQEVVERVAARGHVNRKLCGLLVTGSVVPPAQTALTHDNTDVGHITSAAYSPTLGKIIGLGYVHRNAWEIGTELRARTNDAEITITVSDRPAWRSTTAVKVQREEANHGKPTGQTVPL